MWGGGTISGPQTITYPFSSSPLLPCPFLRSSSAPFAVSFFCGTRDVPIGVFQSLHIIYQFMIHNIRLSERTKFRFTSHNFNITNGDNNNKDNINNNNNNATTARGSRTLAEKSTTHKNLLGVQQKFQTRRKGGREAGVIRHVPGPAGFQT